MKEDKEKRTLKDRAKSGVFFVVKGVTEKVSNFAKKVKENYHRATGIPTDEQEKRGLESIQDKIDRFNVLQFERLLRTRWF